MSNNTYYLEKHLGWKGIAIDALQEHSQAWEKERPGSKFFNFLVTDHSGTDDTFFTRRDRGQAPEVTAYFTVHGYQAIERYRPFDLLNECYQRIDQGNGDVNVGP